MWNTCWLENTFFNYFNETFKLEKYWYKNENRYLVPLTSVSFVLSQNDRLRKMSYIEQARCFRLTFIYQLLFKQFECKQDSFFYQEVN